MRWRRDSGNCKCLYDNVLGSGSLPVKWFYKSKARVAFGARAPMFVAWDENRSPIRQRIGEEQFDGHHCATVGCCRDENREDSPQT